MQVVHGRVRMHSCYDVGDIVTAWREKSGTRSGGWRGIGRAHHDFKSGLIGCVRRGEVPVFPAKFLRSEGLDSRDACADVGEELCVCG